MRRLGVLLVVSVTLVTACVQTTETTLNGTSPVKVKFSQSLETVHYSVTGQSTQDIFASLEANGPKVDDLVDDRFAAGLTELQSGYSYRFADSGSACTLQTVDIDISLVVTLPQHSAPELLSQIQLANWREYVQSIADHEQEHVDIHVEIFESLQETIQGAPVTYSNCDAVQFYLESTWDNGKDLDARRQQGFHDSEEVRLQVLNAPLQRRIDGNKVRLDEYKEMLADYNKELVFADRELATLNSSMATYDSQIQAIRGQYPGLVLPPDIYREYQNLLSDWNALNDQRNQVITERNQLVEGNNEAVSEFNRLSEETGRLHDDLAWVAG